jgi:site-specific recombinase XerD
MTADEYMKATDFEPVRGESLLEGRYVPPEEYHVLIAACNADSITGVRNRAILTVLYMCGLRREELVSLNRKDWTDDGLLVRGKGNKKRIVPVNEDARSALSTWLAYLPDEPAQPIFTTTKLKRLGAQAVYDMIITHSKSAGLEPITPHDLRHGFISNMWDTGEDGATIATIVGHSNIEQTRRYDRRPLLKRQSAVERMGQMVHNRSE